jgi:DnaK suppressor protein
MIEGLRSHHDDIDAALGRLDNGTYGKCERCGREIPIERLEARPTARLCVACKQATGS